MDEYAITAIKQLTISYSTDNFSVQSESADVKSSETPEVPLMPPQPPKLLDQVRSALRARHYPALPKKAASPGSHASSSSTINVILIRWPRLKSWRFSTSLRVTPNAMRPAPPSFFCIARSSAALSIYRPLR